MSTKPIGSHSQFGAIFEQWTAQQQQPLSSSSSSYRILLQTSYSLQNRISAAELVENPHIYRRAGQRTPSEQATRDILGGGESGWLLHLIELAAQAVGSKKDNNISILYIATKPQQSRPADLIQKLPQELQKGIRVLDLATENPWGWGSEEDCVEGDGTQDTKPKKQLGMNNLPLLYHRLRREMSEASKAVILIWQSLSPLILVHGFPTMLRWLQALPPCLQIWPVHQEGLTPHQHALLEDAANALLCMRGGEMTMIREGIRERGNILRQNLSFHLVTRSSGDDGSSTMYHVVEGVQNEENVTHSQKHITEGKNAEQESVEGKSTALTSQRVRPSIQLRLEEENNESSTTESVAGNDATMLRRPKIYFQDDDPEFDDLDEEDPDDDLDI